MADAPRQNILVLSAGRRVSLLQGFMDAAKKLAPHSPRQVFAADMAPRLSAACQLADAHFSLPAARAQAYPAALKALCAAQNIGLVIPTIDTELPILATLRGAFARQGTAIVVSTEALVAECADKRRTGALFSRANFPTPPLYPADALRFPLLVKPYDGALSQGVRVLENANQLTPQILNNPKNIFCAYIDPETHSEFTIDLYFDRQSTLKCVVPRRRIEVRGGEVAKAVAEKNELVGLMFERFATLKGARGCLTFQLFRHNKTRAAYAIEINPRFGGGYPLSRHAGADFQAWLIAEYLEGRAIKRFEGWQDQTMMLRYDAEVILNATQGL